MRKYPDLILRIMKTIAGVWSLDLQNRLQKYEAGPVRGLIWRNKANENNWDEEEVKMDF